MESNKKTAKYIIFSNSGNTVVGTDKSFDGVDEIFRIIDRDEVSYLRQELLSFGNSPFIIVNTRLGFGFAIRKFYEKERLYAIVIPNLTEKTVLSGLQKISSNEAKRSDSTENIIKEAKKKSDDGDFDNFFDLLREAYSFFNNDLRPFRHIYKETKSRISAFSKLFGFKFETEENNIQNETNIFDDYSSSMALLNLMLSYEIYDEKEEVLCSFVDGTDGIYISLYGVKRKGYNISKVSYLEHVANRRRLPVLKNNTDEYVKLQFLFRLNTDYDLSIKHVKPKFEYDV